ncbi:MAG: HAMP domain-containing sensor histidine kinase [Chloroflexota bacterium]
MSLNPQLLIISILPLSFILMALYTWQSKSRRRFVYSRWLFTLLVGVIWASSSMRPFTFEILSRPIRFGWGIVGTYAFSLMIIGILITTFSQLNTPTSANRLTIIISLLIWGGALAIEPRLWTLFNEDIQIAGQFIGQFYLWSGVWVASWVVPLLASLILTQRTYSSVSRSLFKNLLNYWILMLIFLFVSGIFNSINQVSQPGWQQLSVLVAIVALFVGTYSITHTQLPDLPLAIRQLISRLAGTGIVFGLAVAALSYLVLLIEQIPSNVTVGSRNIVFLLAAGIFAIGFTLFFPVITNISQRIFLPAQARRQIVMSEYANAIGNLPEPEQLGQLFLRTVQSNFGTDDAWFFEASDGPKGKLILYPLASLDDQLPEQTVDFESHDPIAQNLRGIKAPLVQYDIDTLEEFSAVEEKTRQMLSQWQRILFMPLHAGDSLIGVLALGDKRSGESYSRQDYDNLSKFGEQVSPLLAQAQNLASLQKINHYVFKQNQVLSREKRHLTELLNLHKQVTALLSPELTKPFASATTLARDIELAHDAAELQPAQVAELNTQLEQLKRPFDKLVSLATRIGSRQSFSLMPVQMNNVTETVIHQLSKMASARRVRVDFEPDPTLPPVLGDHEQLLEAVQHLLHNAIKFNKIGGVVQVSGTVENGEFVLKVVDTGVGIPEDRLQSLWSGLATVSKNGSSRSGGMGLSLTNFIVSAHGGQIKVQSKYGSGTVFALILPLLDEEPN